MTSTVMANQEHLEILRQGADAWGRWREENAKVQPDLSETDLSGADFRRADLSWADLSWADLSWADLSWTDLSWADLVDANLGYADLIGANFSEADLSRASLSEADLSEAKLGRTDLTEADLSRANLSEADLSEAVGLTQVQIDSARGSQNTKLPEGVVRPAHWEKKAASLRWPARFIRAVARRPRYHGGREGGRPGRGSDGAGTANWLRE